MSDRYTDRDPNFFPSKTLAGRPAGLASFVMLICWQ